MTCNDLIGKKTIFIFSLFGSGNFDKLLRGEMVLIH